MQGAREHIALVARDEAGVAGVFGLEVYGAHGLRVGRRRDKNLARTCGLRRLTLLTPTAAGYFPRFGFVLVERAAVPVQVKQSVEFRGACRASAMLMLLAL